MRPTRLHAPSKVRHARYRRSCPLSLWGTCLEVRVQRGSGSAYRVGGRVAVCQPTLTGFTATAPTATVIMARARATIGHTTESVLSGVGQHATRRGRFISGSPVQTPAGKAPLPPRGDVTGTRRAWAPMVMRDLTDWDD
jgi:hypothetical protein